MQFFLDITPPTTTSQQKGVRVVGGRAMHYKKAKVKQAEATLEMALIPYKPTSPITGPVDLYCRWQLPTKNKNRYGKWKTTRPDTDNLNKGLKDCMTRVGFWTDDALVVREIVEKVWSEEPGIYIEIKELEY